MVKKKWTSKNNLMDATSFVLLVLIFVGGFYIGNNMTTNIFVDNPIYDNFVPKGVGDWNMIEQFVTYDLASHKYSFDLPSEYVIVQPLGSQSMFPLMSSTDHGVILKTGVSLVDLNIGDIIIYTSTENKGVLHRIIALSVDEKGSYALVQGDNNKKPDDVRVRSDMIVGVIVGVLY